MTNEIVFEIDMLYPTDNRNEPGSVHIRMFTPNRDARIPVIIESKTHHSPVVYLESILRIMQSDIFDRIFIDVKKSVDLFIKASPELYGESGGKAYIRVSFNGEKALLEGLDSVE